MEHIRVVVKHKNADISDLVISYTRAKDICTSTGVGEIILVDNDRVFEPWDEIIIKELGRQKDLLYVSKVSQESNTGNIKLTCQDSSKKLVDYFIAESYTIDYESYTGYWIRKFMDEAQVDCNIPGNGELVNPNTELGLTSAYDAIMSLLQQSGWYMYFDESGKAIVGSTMHRSGGTYALNDNEILSINTRLNDNILRNRAVVWGGTNPLTGQVAYADVSKGSKYLYGDDSRTVVIANSNIKTPETANRMARMTLAALGQITYEKEVKIAGSPGIGCGDYAFVSSKWFTGRGVVTYEKSEFSDSGLTTTVILNQQCPRIVGMLDYVNDWVYVGTAGSGVWRKPLFQTTPTADNGWETYNSGLSLATATSLNIVDLYINEGVFGTVTFGGEYLYQNSVSGVWTPFTPSGLYDETVSGYVVDPVYARACAIEHNKNTMIVGYTTNPPASGDIYPSGRSWVVEIDPYRGEQISAGQAYVLFSGTEDKNYYVGLTDVDTNDTYNFAVVYTASGTPSEPSGLVGLGEFNSQYILAANNGSDATGKLQNVDNGFYCIGPKAGEVDHTLNAIETTSLFSFPSPNNQQYLVTPSGIHFVKRTSTSTNIYAISPYRTEDNLLRLSTQSFLLSKDAHTALNGYTLFVNMVGNVYRVVGYKKLTSTTIYDIGLLLYEYDPENKTTTLLGTQTCQARSGITGDLPKYIAFYDGILYIISSVGNTTTLKREVRMSRYDTNTTAFDMYDDSFDYSPGVGTGGAIDIKVLHIGEYLFLTHSYCYKTGTTPSYTFEHHLNFYKWKPGESVEPMDKIWGTHTAKGMGRGSYQIPGGINLGVSLGSGKGGIRFRVDQIFTYSDGTKEEWAKVRDYELPEIKNIFEAEELVPVGSVSIRKVKYNYRPNSSWYLYPLTSHTYPEMIMYNSNTGLSYRVNLETFSERIIPHAGFPTFQETADWLDNTIYHIAARETYAYTLYGYDSSAQTIKQCNFSLGITGNSLYSFLVSNGGGYLVAGPYFIYFNFLDRSDGGDSQPKKLFYVLKQDYKDKNDFSVIWSGDIQPILEISQEVPTTIFSTAPSGPTTSGGLLAVTFNNTFGSFITDYPTESGILDERVFSVYDPANFYVASGVSESTTFSGSVTTSGIKYIVFASGSDLSYIGDHLDTSVGVISTFSGTVTHIETTNNSPTPFFFVTTTGEYASGENPSHFMQRDPGTQYFFDYTSGLPLLKVTVIRTDDFL